MWKQRWLTLLFWVVVCILCWVVGSISWRVNAIDFLIKKQSQQMQNATNVKIDVFGDKSNSVEYVLDNKLQNEYFSKDERVCEFESQKSKNDDRFYIGETYYYSPKLKIYTTQESKNGIKAFEQVNYIKKELEKTRFKSEFKRWTWANNLPYYWHVFWDLDFDLDKIDNKQFYTFKLKKLDQTFLIERQTGLLWEKKDKDNQQYYSYNFGVVKSTDFKDAPNLEGYTKVPTVEDFWKLVKE